VTGGKVIPLCSSFRIILLIYQICRFFLLYCDATSSLKCVIFLILLSVVFMHWIAIFWKVRHACYMCNAVGFRWRFILMHTYYSTM
jgi:hypothetical protein